MNISELSSRQNKLISIDPTYDDDGIGTSDDETNSNTSNKTPKDLVKISHLETRMLLCSKFILRLRLKVQFLQMRNVTPQ